MAQNTIPKHRGSFGILARNWGRFLGRIEESLQWTGPGRRRKELTIDVRVDKLADYSDQQLVALARRAAILASAGLR